jgi:hypothetical protein
MTFGTLDVESRGGCNPDFLATTATSACLLAMRIDYKEGREEVEKRKSTI